MGVNQEDVGGSEVALKEAAAGAQEEQDLLSIFWPPEQCLSVGVGFSYGRGRRGPRDRRVGTRGARISTALFPV